MQPRSVGTTWMVGLCPNSRKYSMWKAAKAQVYSRKSVLLHRADMSHCGNITLQFFYAGYLGKTCWTKSVLRVSLFIYKDSAEEHGAARSHFASFHKPGNWRSFRPEAKKKNLSMLFDPCKYSTCFVLSLTLCLVSATAVPVFLCFNRCWWNRTLLLLHLLQHFYCIPQVLQ